MADDKLKKFILQAQGKTVPTALDSLKYQNQWASELEKKRKRENPDPVYRHGVVTAEGDTVYQDMTESEYAKKLINKDDADFKKHQAEQKKKAEKWQAEQDAKKKARGSVDKDQLRYIKMRGEIKKQMVETDKDGNPILGPDDLKELGKLYEDYGDSTTLAKEAKEAGVGSDELRQADREASEFYRFQTLLHIKELEKKKPYTKDTPGKIKKSMEEKVTRLAEQLARRDLMDKYGITPDDLRGY